MQTWLKLTILALSACSVRPEAAPDFARTAIPPAGVTLDQGWSEANRATFAGTAQGSRTMPVAANFRDLFDPADPAWQAKILHAAGRVFERLSRRDQP